MPATMDAWVIREDRFGEPRDAFQIEQMEVPEPGAMEVIVRVMAAGVNYNNVWAAIGEPVSVFRYHAGGPPHRRLGRLGHRRAGRPRRDALEARRRGRHPLQPGVLRGSRGARAGPDGRAVAEDLGLRDDVGLVRRVLQGPGPAAAPQAGRADVGGGRLLRAHLLHRLPDADHGRPSCRPAIACSCGAPPAGSACSRSSSAASPAPTRSASSPPTEKADLCRELGACDVIDRNEFTGMMRRGGETPDEEKARFKESRRFCKLVEEKLGAAPDIVFEHVGQATFPTSVLAVKPFGKRRDLRRHDRLQPRFRRPLPVDEAEADRRLALRERVRVPQGERADRVRERSVPYSGGRWASTRWPKRTS